MLFYHIMVLFLNRSEFQLEIPLHLKSEHIKQHGRHKKKHTMCWYPYPIKMNKFCSVIRMPMSPEITSFISH